MIKVLFGENETIGIISFILHTASVTGAPYTLLCNDFAGGRRTLTDLLRGVGHSIRF